MSDATKRKCGCDWSLWETCDECNPDDEAAEIRRLRTRLAESEAEVGRSRRLRMLAEEAIPEGIEVARDYFAAEAEAKLARANAETDLVRQGLDLERTARLAAEDEAEKWRSEARRALAAEAERDDLLGALRDTILALGGCITEPPCGDCAWCRGSRIINEKGACWRCGNAEQPGILVLAGRGGMLIPCPYCRPGKAVGWMESAAPRKETK